MTAILTFLKSFIKPATLFFVAAIALVSWKYYTTQQQCDELQSAYAELSNKYTALQASAELQQTQLKSTNLLLNEAYSNLDKRTQDMMEIDSIMESTEPVELSKEESSDTSDSTKTKEESYEPITTKQNTAGILFIHRQYDALQ